MTAQHDTVEEPGRSPDECDGAADVDERTSPAPYADDFSEWVADETAPPDDAQPPQSASDDTVPR